MEHFHKAVWSRKEAFINEVKSLLETNTIHLTFHANIERRLGLPGLESLKKL